MENVKQIAGRVALGFSAVSGALMLGFVLAGPSSAAADPVTTAFNDMEGKITTYGTAIVGLVVLAVGIFLGIKYLRKGTSAA